FNGTEEVTGTITEYRLVRHTPGAPTGLFQADDNSARMLLPHRITGRAATGADRYAAVTPVETDFDPATGLPVTVAESGDGPANARCTRTDYTGTVDPAALVWDRVTRTRLYAGACDTGVAVSETSATYDAAGNPLTATMHDGASSITTSLGYASDPYHRPTSSTDGRGNTTTVKYLINTATGFATDIEGTNAAGHTVTIRTDPARGSVLSTTNARGFVSRSTYDPLGRMIAGQTPSESGTALQSVEYRYLFDQPRFHPDGSTVVDVGTTANSPERYLHDLNMVETRTLLRSAGEQGATRDTYTYAYAYIDGLGRTIEVQTASPAGGRVVAPAVFDDRGLTARAIDPYHAAGLAGSGPLNGALPNPAAHEVQTVFDGAGRATTAIELVAGSEVARTTMAYTARSTTTWRCRSTVTMW
ncbi:MAG TPA: hypothetical protein PLV68_15905, partial [Ilumatobacteraceae bacterium]|nr:hypothetical protein [Ilumatobacteraceae bacterium]